MINREKKYTDELTACRKSIERTKRLIDYHKNMLKALESKEKELVDKLDKQKFKVFYELVNKKGYDIDLLCSAFKEGDFSKISTPQLESEQEDIPNIAAIDKTAFAENKTEIYSNADK